jgi:hypothetical protein
MAITGRIVIRVESLIRWKESKMEQANEKAMALYEQVKGMDVRVDRETGRVTGPDCLAFEAAVSPYLSYVEESEENMRNFILSLGDIDMDGLHSFEKLIDYMIKKSEKLVDLLIKVQDEDFPEGESV